MVCAAGPAWMLALVSAPPFQSCCASADGTGINSCSGFIAKESRKRPVLFRGLGLGLGGALIFFFFFFFFWSGFAKMHFLTVKVLKFYRDANSHVLKKLLLSC